MTLSINGTQHKITLTMLRCYAESHIYYYYYGLCHYAECQYAECCYAECFGPFANYRLNDMPQRCIQISLMVILGKI